MIHIKDHKTPDMFDPFPFLGPKRKQRIEASWAKIFREHILPTLPVEKVSFLRSKGKEARSLRRSPNAS